MRILIVAPEAIPVPPILGGSVEITVLAIAKRLAKHHEVTVVSRSHRRYPKHSVVSGVQIYRVPTGRPRAYLNHVLAFLSGKHYDWIQVDNRPRFVAPLKRMFPHTPVSLFLHSLTFVSPPYATKASAAAGLSAADLVVANSASLQRQLSARFPEAAAKLRKVWLGVDTGRFRPASTATRRRAFTLLFAGRMIPRKGLPVLLRAAKLVRARSARPIRVLVAGGAARAGYGRRVRALSRRLGVRAAFLGTVPHRRMHRTYRKADVFVCPSQKHEAFGLVNVEAMASGLPVVASAIGGIREVVRDGQNGFLVTQYRSPRSFADAIARLAADPGLLRRLREEARRDAVERFGWGATAQKLAAIYASHLGAGT